MRTNEQTQRIVRLYDYIRFLTRWEEPNTVNSSGWFSPKGRTICPSTCTAFAFPFDWGATPTEGPWLRDQAHTPNPYEDLSSWYGIDIVGCLKLFGLTPLTPQGLMTLMEELINNPSFHAKE